MEEKPFRPRMRPRAFLRMLKPSEGAPGGPDLLAWSAFAVAVFALARVVLLLRAQTPEGGSAAALATGGAGTTWLVIGAGALGVLGYALHRTRDPAVTLKRGLFRRK